MRRSRSLVDGAPHDSLLERILFAAVIVDVSVALALMFLPPLIGGLLVLLRDVFSALTLPFAVLFGMAGWNGNEAGIGQLVGGMTPGLLGRPVLALSGAFAIVLGAVLSVVGRHTQVKPVQIGAPLCELIGGLLVGKTILVVLLPAILIETGLVTLRPTRALNAINEK